MSECVYVSLSLSVLLVSVNPSFSRVPVSGDNTDGYRSRDLDILAFVFASSLDRGKGGGGGRREAATVVRDQPERERREKNSTQLPNVVYSWLSRRSQRRPDVQNDSRAPPRPIHVDMLDGCPVCAEHCTPPHHQPRLVKTGATPRLGLSWLSRYRALGAPKERIAKRGKPASQLPVCEHVVVSIRSRSSVEELFSVLS